MSELKWTQGTAICNWSVAELSRYEYFKKLSIVNEIQMCEFGGKYRRVRKTHAEIVKNWAIDIGQRSGELQNSCLNCTKWIKI
ncbi:hypothetical protein [Peptoclostridium litorale]|uniref:hypothetical protein n=1 Tax=Peptoclostridium litorale TaxID=1557 RepID=UPI0013563EE1|nr:hypothetical protein [Peptoclostridium litorale]